MGKFKTKRSKTSTSVSTASLPDIIFMLIFFFMMVSVIKDSELKLAMKLPKATELEKLERKTAYSSIHIGKPLPQYQKIYGTSTRMQLNDAFAEVDDVANFVVNERIAVPEVKRDQMRIAIKADQSTKMGYINSVKKELRKVDMLRITYTASEKK